MRKIETGMNDSERKLKKIANNSILHYWSHCNLFKAPGVELCDLIVIFGNNVILFSDKQCKFNTGVDKHLAWSRWYKKAVEESLRQVQGAKRWMINNPSKIYYDAAAQLPFDRGFRINSETTFHLVLVASGIGPTPKDGELHCTLRLNFSESGKQPPIFTVGNPSKNKDFVHVFDESGLKFLLGEMNTINDFLDYLSARKIFCQQPVRPKARHEVDIWALYTRNYRPSYQTRELPVIDGLPHYVVPPNFESTYCSPEYQRKIAADKESFVWDELIKHFTTRAESETLEEGSKANLERLDPALRQLASERRFERRMLSKAFADAASKSEDSPMWCRIVQTEKTTYIFLFKKQRQDELREQYRQVRLAFLLLYCAKMATRNPTFKKVLGIALCPRGTPWQCEDLCYVDSEESAFSLIEAAASAPDTGILEDVEESRMRMTEYPHEMQKENEQKVDKNIHGGHAGQRQTWRKDLFSVAK